VPRPPPLASVSSAASSGSLIDTVRTGRTLPAGTGGAPKSSLFDRFGVSTQSQLFGNTGYGAIFRSLEGALGGRAQAYRIPTLPTFPKPGPVPTVKKKSPQQVVPRKSPVVRPISPPPRSILTGTLPPKPKAIAKVEPEEPVSIHKSLLQSLGGALGTRINSAINPAPKTIFAAGPAIAAGVGAAGRVLPAIGRVLTGRVATAGGIGAAVGSLFRGGADAGTCPSGWHLAKDGSGRCVRNRRMNFGNARAARRSVRRLKGARKLLKDIEKMMPSKTRTRRAAPAGHSAHLHHTGG